MKQIKIVEKDNKWDFEEEVNKILKREKVVDIKFSVAPDIHSGSFGNSYSSGGVYYAMLIIEDTFVDWDDDEDED